jgi:hypothetical protein
VTDLSDIKKCRRRRTVILENKKDGDISLREYVDLRFAANEKAIQLATDALNHRLEGMNEFRDEMSKDKIAYMTKESFEVKHNEITKQVDELRLNRANLEGKASQMSVVIAYIFTVLGIIVSVVLHIIK